MAKLATSEENHLHRDYRTRVRAERVDELKDKIMQKIVFEKKYRDANYSARVLAEELGTNTRYISVVIGTRLGTNYTGFVNEYRIKDAMYMLKDKRYATRTVEEIGLMVGFSNRQSFYTAFEKHTGVTPRAYRINASDSMTV